MIAPLDIPAFTFEQRFSLLDALDAAFSHCGGWVLDRRTLSTTNMEFHIEIRLPAALDLYVGLLAAGIELTRAGHETFTELCTRHKHLGRTTEVGHTIELRIEIAFLDEIAVHSMLLDSPSLA